MNTPILSLNNGNIALACLLVIIAITLSKTLNLKLEKTIAIATARTIIQLSFIGLILAWLFARNHWYETLTILTIMTLIAAYAARSRVKYAYIGLGRDTLIAIFGASWLTLLLTLWLILNIPPPFSPQYLIPIGGMILGNSLTGVSLTADRFTNALRQQQEHINTRLALSATPWEACQTEAREALKAGMMPSINAMNVVGLVSLPGMMTGQILAGADPHQAVKYQIIVMFMMCASCALSCVSIILLIHRRHFNQQQQLIYPSQQEKHP